MRSLCVENAWWAPRVEKKVLGRPSIRLTCVNGVAFLFNDVVLNDDLLLVSQVFGPSQGT